MVRPRRSRSILVALYVNAALLAAVLIALFARDSGPQLVSPAFGQNQPSIAGGAGLYLMPAQFSANTWGCYVMDVDAQTLCAYQFVQGDKYLRFIAARTFYYDRQLKNFNTEPPPLEIKDLVEKDQAARKSKPAAE